MILYGTVLKASRTAATTARVVATEVPTSKHVRGDRNRGIPSAIVMVDKHSAYGGTQGLNGGDPLQINSSR